MSKLIFQDFWPQLPESLRADYDPKGRVSSEILADDVRYHQNHQHESEQFFMAIDRCVEAALSMYRITAQAFYRDRKKPADGVKYLTHFAWIEGSRTMTTVAHVVRIEAIGTQMHDLAQSIMHDFRHDPHWSAVLQALTHAHLATYHAGVAMIDHLDHGPQAMRHAAAALSVAATRTSAWEDPDGSFKNRLSSLINGLLQQLDPRLQSWARRI